MQSSSRLSALCVEERQRETRQTVPCIDAAVSDKGGRTDLYPTGLTSGCLICQVNSRCICFHYRIRQTARFPVHSDIRKGRQHLASQTSTSKSPLLEYDRLLDFQSKMIYGKFVNSSHRKHPLQRVTPPRWPPRTPPFHHRAIYAFSSSSFIFASRLCT